MTIIIIGIVLSLAIIIGILSIGGHILSNFFTYLWDFGISSIAQLFGTEYTILFVSLFTVAGMTLVIRFVMSRIGENPGHSANT